IHTAIALSSQFNRSRMSISSGQNIGSPLGSNKHCDARCGFSLRPVPRSHRKIIYNAFAPFALSSGTLRNSISRRKLMPDAALSGSEFKKQLRAGQPKMGLFLNAHSPTVAEQLAHSGYDWLLVDTQHGPMGYEKL